MGKTVWQVAAAIFASLAVLFSAVAFNTSRALDVANAQLRDRENVAVYVGSKAVNHGRLMPLPSQERCIDGVVFMKVGNTYRSHDDFGQLLSPPCEMVSPAALAAQ